VIKSRDEGFAQGSAEWHNILFVVYDPGASCALNIENGAVKIKQTVNSVSCIEERDEEVEPNEDILEPRTIQVKLLNSTPLVAAVAALEEDVEVPDVPGIATLTRSRQEYLQPSGLTKVEGKECKEISGFPDIGETETINGGHCFDTYFGVSLVSSVGKAALLASPEETATAEADVAKVLELIGT
jgi:hypothetical protein